ncbi:hypothetical protein Nepgr_027376 [Nepenthes gracilis]|uniref:Uncharacterized protein n=1 Tax=Nepenthes gracilis TaxID=150966 RepID=A0AAD3T8S0_NEPGR|nr:hypothetical protein Nepgr_027376 [Nepenthes gracilis]
MKRTIIELWRELALGHWGIVSSTLYLPPQTLKLLVEMAVLEEEVDKLEELFRQGLYQETVCISLSMRNSIDFHDAMVYAMPNTEMEEPTNSTQANGNSPVSNVTPHAVDERGKENLHCTTISSKNKQHSPTSPAVRMPVKCPPTENKRIEKPLDPQKLQVECREHNQKDEVVTTLILQNERRLGDDSLKIISESILKCLMSIFLRMRRVESISVAEELSLLSSLSSHPNTEEAESRDPYVRRLKILLGQLAYVKLQSLSHQGKLAFWINVCNSCMMAAFLERGIAETPEMNSTVGACIIECSAQPAVGSGIRRLVRSGCDHGTMAN